MSENLKKLYNTLQNDYGDNFTADYETFVNDMRDEGKRMRLYQNLRDDYGDHFTRSFDEFSSDIGVSVSTKDKVPLYLQRPDEVAAPVTAFQGQEDPYLRGFIPNVKQGTKGLVEGSRVMAGTTANLFTGSSHDAERAMEILDKHGAEGYNPRKAYRKDLEDKYDAEMAEYEKQMKEWREKHPGVIDRAKSMLPLSGDMPKKPKNPFVSGQTIGETGIVGDRADMRAYRLVEEALKKGGGDPGKAKEYLAGKQGEKTWGDRAEERGAEELSKLKQPKGFAGWVGNLVPQMVPNALAIAASVHPATRPLSRPLGALGMGMLSTASGGHAIADARQYAKDNDMDIPESDVVKAGLLATAIEIGTEMIPFSRYMSGAASTVRRRLGKQVSEEILSNKKAVKEVNDLLNRAAKNIPGSLGKETAVEWAKDLTAESLSEFAAESLDTLVPTLYANREDYPELSAIIANGFEGAKAGLFMGAFLGTGSRLANTYVQNQRRKEQGNVTFADTGKGVVEILGQRGDNFVVLNQNGEVTDIPNDAITDVATVDWAEFKEYADGLKKGEEVAAPVTEEARAATNAIMESIVNPGLREGTNPMDQETHVEARVDLERTRSALDEALKDVDFVFDERVFTMPAEQQKTLVAAVIRDEALGGEQKQAIVNHIISFHELRQLEQSRMEAIEADIARVGEANAEMVNETTGTLVSAFLKGSESETPVAITKGMRLKQDEGNPDAPYSIDVENSDEAIYYIDGNGATQVATADSFEFYANETVEEATEKYRAHVLEQEEIAQAAIAESVTARLNAPVESPVETPSAPVEETAPTGPGFGDTAVMEDGTSALVVEVHDDGTFTLELESPTGEITETTVPAEELGKYGFEVEEPAPVKPTGQPATEESSATGAPTEATGALTEEAALEREKEQFMASLPVFESGKNAGQIDQSQMTPGQNLRYFEYEVGKEKTAEMAAKQAAILKKKLDRERAKLDNDPFNIALNQDVNALQTEYEAYQLYADQARVEKTRRYMEETKGEPSVVDAREQRGEEIAAMEAGRVGSAGDPVVNRWDNAIKVEGIKDVITLANGEKIEGVYVLTTADAPSPSHNVFANFAKTEGFPVNEHGKTVNDRDYEADQAAQTIVRQRANKYDERAVQTPVVVSQEGVVLSGNDRTMAGQLAAMQGTDKAYTDYITEYASRWGFSPKQVKGMKNPRIVFMPFEAMPYNTNTFAKFNAEEKKTQGGLERAIKASKSVSREAIIPLAQIVDGFEKLNDYYNSEAAAKQTINVLLDNGVIGTNEVPGMMDGNVLSVEGRSFVETLMLGAVLNEDALRQVDQIRSAKQTLMRSMPQLMRNGALNEYSLLGELNNAVSLLYEAKQSGNVVELQLRQGNLFEASAAEIYNEIEQILANLLENAKDTEIRAIFEVYNERAANLEAGQADMFDGLLTKPELLQRIIDNYYGREQEKGGEQVGSTVTVDQRGPGQDEQGGAVENEGSRESDTGGQGQVETPADALSTTFNGDVAAFAQDVVKSHEIAREAEKVDTQPTDGQKEAGNYQKGHIKVQGFDITIENPKGSVRSGVDADGKPWETTMNHHYGYFKRSQGKDGDQIDVFIGNNPNSETVFVIDQVNPETGEFDESKVMLGFTSREEAKDAYMSNYEAGWEGFSAITEVGVEEFRKWLYDGAKQRKPFSEYAEVKERQVEESEKQPKRDHPLVEKARKAVEKDAKRVAIEKEVRGEIERLQKEFNTPIIIHEDLSTVDRKTARAVEMKHKAKERVPGWYDADTGTVHVYLPDTKDVADVQKTFFHEVVGHKGLRELLGDRFDEVMADFFDKLPENIRDKEFDYYRKQRIYKNKTDAEIKVLAGEEIISRIAESGDFENVDNRNIIQKLIDAILDWFDRNGISIRNEDAATMADRLLRESAENLRSQAGEKAGQAVESGKQTAWKRPLKKQWDEIKSEYPDAIILFESPGSDFEIMFDDVEAVRSIDGLEGVAFVEDRAYIKRPDYEKALPSLVRNGKRVAIITPVGEQANDSRFRFARDARDFDRLQKEAVENKGIVMPNLNSASVEVVSVPKHDFSGTALDAIRKAEEWANDNIVGKHIAKTGSENEFSYRIDADAVSKFLSSSSTTNSDNLGVHLAVLKKLPDVIDKSIEAEVHADYVKKNKIRSAEHGVGDADLLVHRLYGAVSINGKLYRVKTTIHERKSDSNRPHDYKVTEIELIISGSPTSNALKSSTSVSTTKLLQGVEKSYDKGKKLLEESEDRPESTPLFRTVWHGSPHDFDRFSMDYMGTGEGVQAYGWGLYFTDKEDIGKQYARKLGLGAIKNLNVKGISLYENAQPTNYDYRVQGEHLAILQEQLFANEQLFSEQLSSNEMFEGVQGWFDNEINNAKEEAKDDDYYDGYVEVLEKHRPETLSDIKLERNKDRNLYKVKIHGDKTIDELNFIRWDKPINEAQKRQIAEQAEKEGYADYSLAYRDDDGNLVLNTSNDIEGWFYYKHELERVLGSEKEASLFLLRAGIDGIQYPTEFLSKGEHEDSYNYVVFDENALEIDEHIRFRSIASEAARPLERLMSRRGALSIVERKREGQGVMGHVNMRKEIFANGVHNLEMPKGRAIVTPVKPLVNVYNFAYSNYRSAGPEFLRPIFRNKDLIGLRPDRNGYPILDVESAKKFKEIFDKNIDSYEKFLQYSKYISTEAAQREINDLLDDIDYARWYYSELAEGKDVWRTENDPRFRTENNDEARVPDTGKSMDGAAETSEVDSGGEKVNPRPRYTGQGIAEYAAEVKRYNDEARREEAASEDVRFKVEEDPAAGFEVEGKMDGVIERPRYVAGMSMSEFARQMVEYNEKTRDAVNVTLGIPKPPTLNSTMPAVDVAFVMDAFNSQKNGVLREVHKEMAKISEQFTTFIDRGRPLEKLLQLMEENGAKLTDDTNAYFDFITSAARGTSLINEYEKTRIEPLQETLRKVAKVLDTTRDGKETTGEYRWNVVDEGTGEVINDKPVSTYDKISLYLQARDIVEADMLQGVADRGAKGFENNVREANGKRVTPDAYIAEFEAAVDKKLIAEVWDRVRAVNRWALDLQYKHGMIDAETYHEYTSGKREYYVPQRGWRERDLNEGKFYYVTDPGETPNNPFNAALIKARGRQTLAGDPLAYMQSIGESSVMAAMKNQTKQKFLKFAEENADFARAHDFFGFKQVYYVSTGKLNENGEMIYERTYERPAEEYFERDKEIYKAIRGLQEQREQATLNYNTGKIKKAAYERLMTRLAQRERNAYNNLHVKHVASEAIQVVQVTKQEKEQHNVVVLRDGKEYEIVFGEHYSGERVANVLNRNFGKPDPADVKFQQRVKENTRKATRFMSAMMTQYNPTFAARNFVRDFGIASVGHTLEFGVGYQLQFLKNATDPRLQAAVWRYAFAEQFKTGKEFKAGEGNKYDRYLKEFFEDGAQTGWSFLKDIDQLRTDMKRAITPTAKDVVLHGRFGVTNAGGFRSLFGTLTEASELITRFSTYVTSREQKNADGSPKYSRIRAAMHSKEASVNFDRKGTQRDFTMAYSFFNANIQGSNKIFRLVRDPRVRKLMIGTASLLMAGGVLQAMLTPDPGDDDEREWTEWELMNNLCMGKLKVELPQGLRAFWGFGVQAGLAYRGKKGVSEALLDGTKYFFGEIIPEQLIFWMNGIEIDERTESLKYNPTMAVRGAMPTAVQPLYDVWQNTNFMGGTSYRTEFTNATKDTQAEHSLGKRNVSDGARFVSELLWVWGGGDTKDRGRLKKDDTKVVAGIFDINPSVIETIVSGYSAGTGKFVLDMFTLGSQILDPEKEVDVSGMAIANAFWKQPREYSQLERKLWTLRDKTDFYKNQFNEIKKNNPERYRRITSFHASEHGDLLRYDPGAFYSRLERFGTDENKMFGLVQQSEQLQKRVEAGLIDGKAAELEVEVLLGKIKELQ